MENCASPAASRLYVATHNAGKLREIGDMLPGVEIVADDPDVEESGATFEANALLKARATAARHPGEWTMADDSGLEVEALGGAPGVHSARYAGEPVSTPRNNAKLLAELEGQGNRRARFTCCIALVDPEGVEHMVSGHCLGTISRSPSGGGGFGYDPLFVPEGHSSSFAELGESVKNGISHRARAMSAARLVLGLFTPAELAAVIDHTFLSPAGAPDAVEKLCAEAAEWKFACAMVHPCEVARCVSILSGSGVRTGTVIGFPLGQNTVATMRAEAAQALGNGARDLDFVINRRLVKYGTDAELDAFLAPLAEVCRAPEVVSKVIIEACDLSDGEKTRAARAIVRNGFNFVKTSTGFGAGGATASDVALLRRTVGPEFGVKAAGGIRTLDSARALLRAGATRIGASCGVSLVRSLASCNQPLS